MTPQERQMVADLFDRLASLEGGQRDPDAERAMREGLARAPNAVYALVQTVLLQEEALKRANTRIEELEHAVNPGPAQTQSGGFLDSMRSVFAGQSRGSVPSVRTGAQAGGQGSSGAWGTSPPPPPPPGYQPQAGYPPQPGYMQGAPMGGPMMGAPMMGGGGSFLGTAAAAAAGVIGGSMLLNGIRGAFGAGGSHQTFGDGQAGGFGSSPWGGGKVVAATVAAASSRVKPGSATSAGPAVTIRPPARTPVKTPGRMPSRATSRTATITRATTPTTPATTAMMAARTRREPRECDPT